MKKFILLTTLLLPFIMFSQTQLGSDINGEAGSDNSGRSVSMSSDGTIVAIGAPYNDGNYTNSGHVRVFQYSSGNWVQLGADIDGEALGDYSGNSVSLSNDGTRVAIGAYQNDGGGSSSGHVRVYEYNGASWIQMGGDIDGEGNYNFAGTSVALSGQGATVAIGATNSGSGGDVRVFSYVGSQWIQVGSDFDAEAASDSYGYSVSLSDDGSEVAIGAVGNDGNGSNSGHVRIYQWNGIGSWIKLGSDIDGEAANDNSGYSVSLSSDGTKVAIGAYGNDGGGSNSGHVRVYEYDGGSWSQPVVDIDGEAAGDISGRSVSLSSDGTKVAIGALGNDGGGSNSGHVRVYDILTPEISSVSLAADNSTITVTTSLSVYNSSGGSSDLEASDFALSISGGSATLTSATPTSISKTSQSVWVLGVGLTGTPTGGETLTVTPVA
ncbi:MAG: hypothetical protein P8P15_05495, partial [Polaribacter sp.]|nr:hypothetical protein [Polaribacter sp.]